MTKSRVKFSLSLVAVIALIALVVGVVGGRAAGGSSGSSGGGAGGAAAGKKVDVIIKASRLVVLADDARRGAEGRRRLRPQGRALRAHVGDRHQPAGPADRELDLARGGRDRPRVRTPPTRSTARSSARRQAGIKVITADTAVTTDVEGFIGTDNVKAGEQAGQRMCDLAKKAGKSSGDILIESSVAGIQTLKDRDGGFRRGLAAACPGLRVATHALQQQRPQHRGQPGQRRRSRPTRASSGSSPTTTPRAPAPRARSRTTRPPTGSRSSPSTPTRRRTRR